MIVLNSLLTMILMIQMISILMN